MKSIAGLFSLILFAFCLPPGNILFVFFSHEMAFDIGKVITLILFFYWVLFYFVFGDNKSVPVYAWFFLMPILSYVIIGIYHSEFSGAIIGVMRFIALFFSVVVAFNLIKNNNERCDLFIVCFFVFAAICVWIGLLVSFYFPDGIWQFTNPDGRVSNYYLLSTSNAIYEFSGLIFPRMAFFFDEPGTYGAFSLLALIYMKLTNKSKYAQAIVLTSGIATFSLGFIFPVLCLFLFDTIKLRSFVFLFFCFFVFYFIYVNFPAIAIVADNMLFGRVESILSDGSGDTRSAVTRTALNLFFDNPIWGVGFNQDGIYDFFGANIFFYLAMGGVVFSLCYLPLIYLLGCFFYRRLFGMLCSLLLLYIQRPDFLMPYSVVFTSFCVFVCLKKIGIGRYVG
ncbi:hypothetical protein ACEUDE_02985 [Aeromonas veronii]